MNKLEAKKQLYAHGLISIIRGNFTLEEILKLAEALLKGGVKVVEITLNSANALEGIAAVQKTFGNDMLVGAGTVRTAEDVNKALAAGSTFLIAPCLDIASLAEAKKHNALLLPGIFTATEAQTAFVAGCETVKLFPADTMGAGYLKALRAPLDHIDFIPTGGVDQHSLESFHKAGAVAFGVGSALVKNVAIDSSELAALSERARLLHEALLKARAHA